MDKNTLLAVKSGERLMGRVSQASPELGTAHPQLVFFFSHPGSFFPEEVVLGFWNFTCARGYVHVGLS